VTGAAEGRRIEARKTDKNADVGRRIELKLEEEG
jgi:hypothetical protein